MIAPLKPGLNAPTPRFPWVTAPLSLNLLFGYLAGCVTRGIRYGLGAKADGGGRPLAAYPPRYQFIDCSGFVRAAIAYASNDRLILPDGSCNQHDWCDAVRLKKSSLLSCLRNDGILRICFIVPTLRRPVGHVFLCRNGRTMESYGGHGPGSRSVLVHVLQVETTAVYVLSGV